MENNTQPVTAQELPNVAMHPRTGFPSEEAMKAYYLQLIDIMNIAYVKESSEYVSLQCLKRKLRQFIHVLQLLGTHEWGNGIAEIQDASGFYMLQSTLPHKTLLQANREIGLHLQFITPTGKQCRFSETTGRYLILPLSKCRKLAEEGERRIDRYFLK